MNLLEHAESREFDLFESHKLPSDVAKLTPKNVENLRELASMLKHVPEESFSMAQFVQNCGTVCCAVGWAAQFGIGNTDYKAGETLFDWESYSINEFCGGSDAIWEYLFDAIWKYHEPTVEQAIQRIERVLNAHRECQTH